MKSYFKLLSFLMISSFLTSCVSNKKYNAMQTDLNGQLEVANGDIARLGEDLTKYMSDLNTCEEERTQLKNLLNFSEEQLVEFKNQVVDAQTQLERQISNVGDLTVLSSDARDNINESLAQLQKKNIYIEQLIAAKTQADSINLALALNLKSVLADGLNDSSIDVKVDKTVVFINLSDKMLYKSGRSTLNKDANKVLEKIAKIIASRPDLEVMVEGYTDNVPMKKSGCLTDNWDLSVKRATSVVRALQVDYGVNPNRLIAAGRGEYNTMASNESKEGRATNRRTRIILMPKLNQFYNSMETNMSTSLD